MFVKPYECDLVFEKAASYIAQQELERANGVIYYCQTQNDNLRHEYESLFKDVPKSIPFARIALQRDPDAVNFWLGNSRSVTALHKDPYENIYVQVLGQKHFVLLPPIESACVNEQLHPAATYKCRYPGIAYELGNVELFPTLDNPAAQVPFAAWDPDLPEVNATAFSSLSRPMRVTLEPGDMLYLPALWYHKVSQSCNKEGLCCAVNYWYDMEYSGSFYPLSTFSRRISLLATSGNALAPE
ncbi:hypothetical protein, variant [Verruconis gallopava]|nr:hypothetical protein, variant [Verruconis gallopava]KIW03643.1 hypothetical protein, variant [Verruconis gallopava]